MGRIFQRFADPLPSPWNSVVKMSLVLVCAMWFLLVGAKVLEAEQSGITGTTPKDCPLIPLSKHLNEPQGWGKEKQTILAFVDFGPELLYRTPHRVIMTPYHRNTDGILDAHRILSDSTGTFSRNLLKARKVDLILTCPSSPTESAFFQTHDGSESFYDQLDQGRIPDWIHQVPLPPSLADHFKMFQVQLSEDPLPNSVPSSKLN